MPESFEMIASPIWCFRGLALLAMLAILGGCGFRPMKAARSGDSPVVDDLAAVKIELINERIGQELRNDLLDRLNPDGQPTRPGYSLAIKLHENLVEVGISAQNTASRADLTMTAEFTLTALPSGDTLLHESVDGLNSYGLDPNSYATVVSRQNAEQRLLRELADDIALRLGLYFHRQAEEQK